MTIKDKVENLLAQDQKYRDSDKQLLLTYWEMQGLVLSERQTATFLRCTAAESITRARRELKGQYPASHEVTEARYEKFNDYRNAKAVSWLED